MSNKLSQKKIEEMFAAYQEHDGSVNHVSKKCGIHHKTVQRYREKENWDERLAEIKRKAQEKADYTLAKARAENISLVRFFKSKLAETLDTARREGTPLFLPEGSHLVSVLIELAKLEELLMGGATERIGQETAPPVVRVIVDKLLGEGDRGTGENNG